MCKLLISVIVPIYNSEKNLKICLDHLVNQTFNKIEIILIDDGSTDMSKDICFQYMRKYENIVYRFQHNQGVSSARNLGISIAKGEYICFCDSDDYYELDAIEKMYSNTNQGEVDLIISKVRKNILGNIGYVSCGNKEAFTKENLSNMLHKMSKNYMLYQMWGKLFKRKIIIDNNIFLKTSLSIGEDLEWMCSFAMYLNSIISIDDITYNYIICDKKSLSQKFYKNYFMQLKITFSRLLDLFLLYEMSLGDFELLYISNVWDGIRAISKPTCNLGLFDKITYVKEGINDIKLKSYMQIHKGEISKSKYFLLSLPSFILTLTLLIGGKFNDYFKDKEQCRSW